MHGSRPVTGCPGAGTPSTTSVRRSRGPATRACRRMSSTQDSRRVPVVDHVVVIEDHGAGHHRQHPALHLGLPRLVVQPGVLLEVGHVVQRRVAVVVDRGRRAARPPWPGSPETSRRRTPDHRRTGARCGHWSGDCPSIRSPWACSASTPRPRSSWSSSERPRRLVGSGRPARTEQDPDRSAVERADHARREPTAGERPARSPSRCTSYGCCRARRQALDDHQGVVMIEHANVAVRCPRTSTEHGASVSTHTVAVVRLTCRSNGPSTRLTTAGHYFDRLRSLRSLRRSSFSRSGLRPHPISGGGRQAGLVPPVGGLSPPEPPKRSATAARLPTVYHSSQGSPRARRPEWSRVASGSRGWNLAARMSR